MKKRVFVFLILFVLLMIAKPVFSQDFSYVLSNSEKWQDVYSSIHFANLEGLGSGFLVSTRHGSLILNEINKKNKIMVISSRDKPYVFNYPDLIRSRGFEGVSEIVVDDANLELIEQLPDIKNFVIVSDSYGYNAIAVAPYAVQTRSWVFFANKYNIYDIDNILSRRNIEKILLYGYLDREVRDVLSKYNPEVIDTGDRFEDNIEIVKKYLKVKPTKQVVLTNGEFIEYEVMRGLEPVLFTGKENVPDKIRDYLKNSDIEVGVLIGNDLVGAATNIRRSTGISVMVKFARGARSLSGGGIAAVEGLDLYPVPTPSVKLSLFSVKYNTATSQLEVTYKSDSNLPIYVKGTITLISNTDRVKVGDIEPVFIAPGDYKTIVYDVEIVPENLKAEIYTIFGDAPSSLDRILEAKTDVEIIEVIDRCKFNEDNVNWVKYNLQKSSFIVGIKNNFDVDCWVDLEFNDVIINNRKETFGVEGAVKISAGKSKKIYLKKEMTKEDLSKNPFIDLTLYSGEKENSLVNVFRGKFELKIESLSLLTYALIVLGVIIVILLIILFILKKREEEF